MIVRGAPEEVISLSPSLAEPDQRALDDWLSEKGRAGERTIAIAKRVLPPKTTGISPEDEQDLEFLGALAFTDPIKPSAYRAVEKAKELGVSIKIITGDNCEVAGAVGVRIGLLDDPTRVISGSALMAMPPDKREQAVVEHAVFARVTPEQKYEIIRYTPEFLHRRVPGRRDQRCAGAQACRRVPRRGQRCRTLPARRPTSFCCRRTSR